MPLYNAQFIAWQKFMIRLITAIKKWWNSSGVIITPYVNQCECHTARYVLMQRRCPKCAFALRKKNAIKYEKTN